MLVGAQLCVDWNADGDFLDSGEDISAYVYDLEWRMGRDYASMLTGRATAGTLSATLKNTDGRFNSFLSTGPYYGNLLPGRKVRLWLYTQPSQLASLHAWYKADALTGYSAGDPLTSWPDSGPNGFDAAVITAPTYRATDGPNSMPCVRFASASSQGLSADGIATALTGQDKPVTVMAVVKNTSLASTYTIWSLGNSASGTPYAWFWTSNLSQYVWERRDDAVLTKQLKTGTPSTTSFQIVRARFDGSLGSLYINGTQSGVDTDLDVSTITVNRCGIGNLRRNTNSQFFNGDIAELIVLKSPSVADEVLVEYYLSNKYQLGTLGVQWTGLLDRIQPEPVLGGAHRARLTATGPLGFINQKQVQLAMSTSVATGTAVGNILTDTGWAVGDRVLDTGKTTIARHWVDGKLALSALREVEETENGFLRETKTGSIAFEDRHHRLLSPHTTSQATLTDAAGATLGYSQIQQGDPLREIYNRIEASVQRYTVGGSATLWTLSEAGANSPALAPGQSRDFWARYPNPDNATNAFGVDAWTTPAATTDYTANTAADGSGTDLTGSITVSVSKLGNSMKISLTNTHATSTAYLTLLQARGTPITADDPVRIVSEDSTSQTRYGKRTWPNPAPFIPTTEEADSATRFVLSVYKDPIPVLTLTIPASRNSTHLREVLARDVSDRITVTANNATGTNLGVNTDFFVEGIHYQLTEAGYRLETTYEVSPATGYSGFITLDVGPALDTGRLAY